MRKILKAFLLFCMFISVLMVSVMFLVMYTESKYIILVDSNFKIKNSVGGLFLLFFSIGLIITSFLYVPLIMKDVFWNTQKEIDELRQRLWDKERELQRKIDKL